MKAKNTDEAVAYGIQKTINRFHENPFLYFTESDLHAALLKDIVDDNPDLFNVKIRDTALRLSMAHVNYPSRFLFSRAEALKLENPGAQDYVKLNGNLDLVVLRESKYNQIVKDHFERAMGYRSEYSVIGLLDSIITNDIDQGYPVDELMDYAIDVTFYRFKDPCLEVFEEIKIDNFKLAKIVERGTNVKAVNLIFSYYHWKNTNWITELELETHPGERNYIRNNKIRDLNSYLVYDAALKLIPDKVLNIFIDVRLDANGLIEFSRPSFYYNDGNRKLPYWVRLLTKGFEGNREVRL